MRLLLHDYAGHPFQAELSRRLAARGHDVMHAYFSADAGPKGRMSTQPGDAARLRFVPIDVAGEYSKTNFVKRRAGDISYGKALSRLIRDSAPDVVISGNTPTEAQDTVPAACSSVGAAFVYWCQDFYSIAASRLLEKRLPVVGHVVGAWYKHLDARQMRKADHVILITEAFRAQTVAWNVAQERVSVIPNWGAIDEIPVSDGNNEWAREQGFDSEPVCLYTGTLAMKHDPRLLEAVAREGRADVVVVASGVGTEALATAKAEGGLERLHLLPLQPFERFAEVLGSADVLMAVIEREAGEFSVPSKVLSYLCAGKPIVLSAPKDNLAAQIIEASGAGSVVEPGDSSGFVAAVRRFLDDREVSAAAGLAGRAYAEAHFDLDHVADRFEAVLARATSGS